MPSSFRLKLATLEDKAARDLLTHSAWGDKLTVEQFADRELSLRAHAWAQSAMRTWLLLGGSGQVLCSCESFRMNAFDPTGAPTHIEAIASVFTEPLLRGRGFASELLERVSQKLEQEGSSLILLHSEVGAGIYSRVGFRELPSFDRVFPAASSDAFGRVEPFTRHELPSLWAALTKPRSDSLTLWPECSQLDWYLEREAIYSRLLARKPPEFAGARMGSSFLAWYADYKSDCLRALFFRATQPSEARLLIQAALTQAARLGLPVFRSWESEEFQNWDARELTPKGRREPRADIAMIRGNEILSVISRSCWV